MSFYHHCYINKQFFKAHIAPVIYHNSGNEKAPRTVVRGC